MKPGIAFLAATLGLHTENLYLAFACLAYCAYYVYKDIKTSN